MKKEFLKRWQDHLEDAIDNLLSDPAINSTIPEEHINKTPERFVESIKQQLAGCLVDPAEALETVFPADGADQMVHVKDILFHSVCAHHLVPFFGSCSFAYIPNQHIAGLSKIPRLIDAYAKRPQVQEKLTKEIVETFYDKVKPLGCGLLMRAYHLCMICRGAEEPHAYTETTAIKGNFYKWEVKQEFIASAQAQPKVWG